jgi:hypothetical protein
MTMVKKELEFSDKDISKQCDFAMQDLMQMHQLLETLALLEMVGENLDEINIDES